MQFLGDYIIYKNENGLFWKTALTDELVMKGRCSLCQNVLILHAYESIDAETLTEVDEKWNVTDFYMTVSESGAVAVYNVSDGTLADDAAKKEIGTQIGCTLRFRQG